MSDSSFQLDDELLSAYIDGQLSADELRAVQQWIERDPAARATVEELRNVSDMVQSLPRETLPADWNVQLAQRLDAAAASSDATGSSNPGAANAGGSDHLPMLPFGRSSRGWWYSGAAVAAAIAIVCYSRFVENPQPGAVALKQPAAAAEVVDDSAVDEVPELRAATEPEADAEMLAAAPAMEAAEENAPESTPLAAAVPAAATTAAEDYFDSNLAGDNAYLIVWADVPPETLRAQQFNQVLGSNGIRVENGTATWTAAAEPMRQQIELRNQLGDSSSVDRPARVTGGGGGFGGSSRFSVPDRLQSQPNEVADEAVISGVKENESELDGETILVEATADQIAACLADMQQDTSNYREITVEPVAADGLTVLPSEGQLEQSAARRQSEMSESAMAQSAGEANDNGAAPAQRYGGRGGYAASVPRAQRLQRPNTWYFYNAPPQETTNAYQVRGKEAKSRESQPAALVDNKQVQLDNLNRLLTQQATNRATMQQQQPLTQQQPVQVLFVLRNSQLAELPMTEVAPADAP